MSFNKSNGWQSAETANNPRHLLRDAVSIRANVHRNQHAIEIVIHDLDAPRNKRWTSITFNRLTGETGVGCHRDANEAWKIALQRAVR